MIGLSLQRQQIIIIKTIQSNTAICRVTRCQIKHISGITGLTMLQTATRTRISRLQTSFAISIHLPTGTFGVFTRSSKVRLIKNSYLLSIKNNGTETQLNNCLSRFFTNIINSLNVGQSQLVGTLQLTRTSTRQRNLLSSTLSRSLGQFLSTQFSLQVSNLNRVIECHLEGFGVNRQIERTNLRIAGHNSRNSVTA